MLPMLGFVPQPSLRTRSALFPAIFGARPIGRRDDLLGQRQPLAIRYQHDAQRRAQYDHGVREGRQQRRPQHGRDPKPLAPGILGDGVDQPFQFKGPDLILTETAERMVPLDEAFINELKFGECLPPRCREQELAARYNTADALALLAGYPLVSCYRPSRD